MATGTVLWAYMLAGGIPAKEWTSSLIPLKITHPEFLVAMFLVVAVHASWRYWYYGVHLPLTRTKIRQYLQTPESVLVFSAVAPIQIPVIRNRNQEDDLRCMLGERLLPGMEAKDFLFFSDTDPGGTQADMVRFLLARKLQKYFPGLQPHNIFPETPSPINRTTSTGGMSALLIWEHAGGLGLKTLTFTPQCFSIWLGYLPWEQVGYSVGHLCDAFWEVSGESFGGHVVWILSR